MTYTLRKFPWLLWALALPILAQKPVINAVTNAASFAPMNVTGHALAPGSMATIFGSNLASGTAIADGAALSTILGGTSVTAKGVLAPLFYVSPGQINFQVPSSTVTDSGPGLTYGQAPVIVTTGAGVSDPVNAGTYENSPGIFTLNATGCGQAAVLNVAPDGTVSLNSPSNSASPGDWISVFGTGIGIVYSAPPDGRPAPGSPLTQSEVVFGAWLDGVSANTRFMGRAPGLVGVDQLNAWIPPGVRQGCAVPLSIGSRTRSKPALVSIHAGGGACVDPPIAGAGEIVVTKSVVLNDPSTPESDIITATFSAAPGKQLKLPPETGVGGYALSDVYDHPNCAIPGYSTLNGGAMTVTGPAGFNQVVQPSTSGGEVSYAADLPRGTVQPGTSDVAFAGGAGSGAFQTNLQVAAPIQITSQFPRGTEVVGPPFTITWTGGQAGQTVTLTIRERVVGGVHSAFSQAPATDGHLTMHGFPITGQQVPGEYLPMYPSSDVEVIIEVGPDVSTPQVVSAPGLSLGSLVTWKYEYRFTGLTY